MDAEQLQHYRAVLLARRGELEALEDENREAAGTVVLDQSRVGRLSRMDAMQAQQMARETARRRQLQLQQIAGALRRIDKGDYGECFICGDDIGAARLDIEPASTRCVNCLER